MTTVYMSLILFQLITPNKSYQQLAQCIPHKLYLLHQVPKLYICQ